MPDTKIFPCAHVDHNGREDWEHFNNNENPLYSKPFIKLRQDLAEGKKPKICNRCWALEDIGIPSPRQLAIKNFKEYITTDEDDLVVRYVDMKFDNYCNFSCRMCNSWNSSKIDDIITENSILESVFSKTKIPNTYNFQQEKKYVFLKNLLDQGLEHIKVTGGEPTISKYFNLMLDYCIQRNIAKNITLSITTNGSKFTDRLLSKLSFFKQVNYNISIDGKGKIYEYIRHPFYWDKLVYNIEKLFNFYENDSSKIEVRSSCVVSVYNFLDILDLDVWWNKIIDRYEFFSVGPISIDTMFKPQDSYLNIANLDNQFIESVMQESLHSNVRKYLESSLNDNKKSKRELLRKNTILLDECYNKSFEDYLNSKIIKYIKEG